jgi:hypothetical protein
VTHGSGVYDITDFIDGHPGGSQRIMMAAGRPYVSTLVVASAASARMLFVLSSASSVAKEYGTRYNVACNRAGGSIDTFWSMYRQHQTKEVQAMLEQYRIGDLVIVLATQCVTPLTAVASPDCYPSAATWDSMLLSMSSNIVFFLCAPEAAADLKDCESRQPVIVCCTIISSKGFPN